MPANPVLVDSSHYIRLLREGRDPLAELAVIGAQREVATCGVIRCEVGRGLKAERVLQRFHAAWDVMLYVPTDNRLWADAERLLWELDRKGQPIPLPDAVIACCDDLRAVRADRQRAEALPVPEKLAPQAISGLQFPYRHGPLIHRSRDPAVVRRYGGAAQALFKRQCVH